MPVCQPERPERMNETTAADQAPQGAADASGLTHNNVLRLALAQALGGANSAMIYSTGAIVGHSLAPTEGLATLPISIFVVGMAVSTLPTGLLAERYGRRAAFLAGSTCGILVGLLAALAVVMGQFWLYCLATFFGGAYAAVVMSFRFAAADGVSPDRRARALSFVMAGGVFAGIIGPQLVTHTMYLMSPYLFAGSYIAQALVALVAGIILLGVRTPRPNRSEPIATRAVRPLSEIARQPRFIAAVVVGVVTYMLMNFLMTAAPLAMSLCGLPQESSNLAIQWHVVAMYAPSFVTGALISRFGGSRVVALGLVLIALAAAVALTGIDEMHFWVSLIILGVGWNFGFLGASSLVLECHRPEEKARVQSLNDFAVFGTMAVGSFLSGQLLTSFGWNVVLWLSFVPLLPAFVALGINRISRRSEGPLGQ